MLKNTIETVYIDSSEIKNSLFSNKDKHKPIPDPIKKYINAFKKLNLRQES